MDVTCESPPLLPGSPPVALSLEYDQSTHSLCANHAEARSEKMSQLCSEEGEDCDRYTALVTHKMLVFVFQCETAGRLLSDCK